MSYIQVDHLQKTFTVRKKREKGRLLREKETVYALRDLCFQVEKGELVGYIGPNGGNTSGTSAWFSASGCSSGGMCRSWTAIRC